MPHPYTWKPDLPDPRDRIFNLRARISQGAELPRSVDLAPEMPKIWNQMSIGSCTAHGNARVFLHQAMRQGEPEVTPSRLFIYYNERVVEGTTGEDSGAQVRTGIKVLASQGAPPESDWPYDPLQFAVRPPEQAYADAVKHEAVSYERILAGGPGAPLRTALAEHKAIVFGFTVPERFESPSWNPATEPLELPSRKEGFLGGHCVVATGYDFSRTRFPFDVFQIDNSWGPEWGFGGRFWMEAAWLNQSQLGLSSDFWVVTRTT